MKPINVYCTMPDWIHTRVAQVGRRLAMRWVSIRAVTIPLPIAPQFLDVNEVLFRADLRTVYPQPTKTSWWRKLLGGYFR